MHVVTLGIFSLIVMAKPVMDATVTIVIPNKHEKEEELDRLDLSVDLTESYERLSEIGLASLGVVEEALPPPPSGMVEVAEPDDLVESAAEMSGMDLNMPELVSNDNAGLVEDLAGIQGAIATTLGDTGSVDRITTEILARLELGDVLIAWLMDASESLRPRREQIIRHFTRVYDELDVIAEGHGDALLTSVIAFGQSTVEMTPAPTADRREILESVREIEADDTGVENVFSAIKATAQEYAKFSRVGRKVMLIVVTDENGNDATLLDDALALLKRHRMTVHVIGPVAPFARKEIIVKWIDPQTTEPHYLPVDCGPETAYVEQATLAVWKDGPGSKPMCSGFGPYALTRIARASGGLYLMHDDGRIAGPSFDAQQLTPYKPDYVTAAEYQKLAARNSARMTVLRISQANNKFLKEPLPRVLLSAGIQYEIKPMQKRLGVTVAVLNRSLLELNKVERARDDEASPRWRAHYDLLVGRLLANKVRCYSCAQLLADMYEQPRVTSDLTKNAWELTSQPFSEEIAAAWPAELREEADLSRQHLQRVIDEHPDTPWAKLAKDELDFAFSFDWQEAFLEPPAGVPLPWDKKPWDELTVAEKSAKRAFEKKKQSRQKRKEAAKDVVKRSPPKL